MIKFEKESTKKYSILNDDEVIFDLNLISSTVTNKFHIITDFVEKMCEHSEDFNNWFISYLEIIPTEIEVKYTFLEKSIPSIKQYVDEFLDQQDVDFDNFVDMSKVKKSSILFLPYEIKQITRLSCYLKIYSFISNNSEFALDARQHKEIYNGLSSGITSNDIAKKIFDIVKTKTFRYNLTDKYMWEYLKMIQCKSIDVHVIEIFNFIMNSIIVLSEVDKNPITYFVSVIEESVKWFLRSVYKTPIVYEDSISTENIHSLSSTNLKTYSYNDTLGRLKGIAYNSIYTTIERESNRGTTLDDLTVSFQNRCSEIDYISPLCECMVYPILSKALDIPYHHFKTISAEHGAILSAYLHKCMRKVFRTEYKNVLFLLDYFPRIAPSVTTTYQIKQIHDFINVQNEVDDFFGFKTKIISKEILNFFIGRISRGKFVNIFDGKELVGIPLSKIELDMIHFYSKMFANKFDNELDQIRNIIGSEF